MFEWVFSAGSITTIAFILFASIGFYWKTTYDVLLFRETLDEIKSEIKELHVVVVDLATQKQRLDSQADRLNRLDARIDQLREGKGYILAKEFYQDK
jgi:cell division protein FtsB